MIDKIYSKNIVVYTDKDYSITLQPHSDGSFAFIQRVGKDNMVSFFVKPEHRETIIEVLIAEDTWKFYEQND